MAIVGPMAEAGDTPMVDPTIRSQQLIIIDDGTAKELIAEGVGGAAVTNGLAKINLISSRFHAERNRAEFVVVARLTMPLSSIVSLNQAINELLRQSGMSETAEKPAGPSK